MLSFIVAFGLAKALTDLAARDVLVVAGAVIAVVAFTASLLFVHDTAAHVALEQRHHAGHDGRAPSLRAAFADMPPRPAAAAPRPLESPVP